MLLTWLPTARAQVERRVGLPACVGGMPEQPRPVELDASLSSRPQHAKMILERMLLQRCIGPEHQW